MNELSAHIEALLYALGRPLSRSELQKMLGVPIGEIEEALRSLSERLAEGGGIVLVDDASTVELRIGATSAALIETVRKEEYSRDIGKAGLEVLSAILYRGPLTRSEIDFIRGVNSSQTLRTLTMRGFVRRVEIGKDHSVTVGRKGSFLYEPTTELLSELGVSEASDLPEYASVREKLRALEEAYRAKEVQTNVEDL